MTPAVLVLIGLTLWTLAALGVTARQASLVLLGAIPLVLAYFWPVLTHAFGG